MIQHSINGFEIYEYPAINTSKQKNIILFAHANGIPAQTYNLLFERISNELNCSVISYDMRGIGKTVTPHIIKNKNKWTWDILTEDHVQLFLKLKQLKNTNLNWIFLGHSLGAWISLLASQKIFNIKLILLDPPILRPNIIIKWTLAHFLNKRHLSPMSQKVKKRKTIFPSLEIACQELKKSSLMKNWDDTSIQNYVEASFKENIDGNILLRHDPLWEAHLFEEYPMGAWLGFLKIPYSIRKNIAPIFIVGALSDTCNPKAKKWVQFFFPHLKWTIIANAKHMFPIEMQTETISIIKHNL
jgi:pimeloyl-ACP methyl ester carboxylesterase